MDAAAPADPAALFDLGNTLFEQGSIEPAIAAFRQCLAIVPDHVGTHYNLGNALLRAGRPTEAVEAYVRCVRLAADFGPGYVNLADTLRRLGLLEQARWAAETGLCLLPALADAKACLANVLHDAAEYEQAAELYRQALAGGASAGTWSSLGNTLRAAGRLAEALEAHERAIAAAPGDAELRFSRALTLLAAGDLERGFAEYEWRWLRPGCQPRVRGKWWKGEDLTGRILLLHAEQGLGDTLQFLRYAPLLARRGARVVLDVQPELVRLAATVPGVTEVVAPGRPPPPFDLQCPLLSVPRVIGTRLDSIPAELPYLHPDAALVAGWAARLPQDGVPRVGLCWAGAAHADDPGARLIDARRSIGLAGLAALGGIGGVRFVSLQHGPPAAQLAASGLAVLDLMHRVEDMADTAALVLNLDLVIAVDSAVAHLAGALGRPVWLLSRYDGCWRWLHGRDDSPWYPGLRLYRQPRPLDWTAVAARLRHDLIAWADRMAPRDHPAAA